MTGNLNDNDRAHHIPDDDLVLFALQLLPEERMTQAMAHLQACPECRAEVARIQGDLAAYSTTAPPEPPLSGSRERFLRQIAREPRSAELPAFQLKPTEFELRQPEKLAPPPEPPRSEQRVPDQRLSGQRVSDRTLEQWIQEQRTQEQRTQEQRIQEQRTQEHAPERVPARPSESDRSEDRPDRRARPDPQSSEPVFSARQSRTLTRGTRRDDREDVEVYREQRVRPRRAPWVLAWTGWALAAGCSFVAGLQLHQRQQMQGTLTSRQARLDDMQTQVSNARQAQEALSTLTAASAMQVALHASPAAKPAIAAKGAPPVVAPEALAAYLADKGALVFVATHMAPAPPGKTYELWLLPASGQSPIPAGTFKPDAQGSASIVLPTLPKGVPAKGFGVTVENDGGSPTPTLPILMS